MKKKKSWQWRLGTRLLFLQDSTVMCKSDIIMTKERSVCWSKINLERVPKIAHDNR